MIPKLVIIKMPGTRCTVAICNNSKEKTKRSGEQIYYHKFPKSDPYRNIWVQRCRRAGVWNPNSCHICSIHFTSEDYIDSAYRKRLRPTGRYKLIINC